MRTLVLEPSPAEVTQLLERRRRMGLYLYDEIWGGTYHVAPMARYGHGRLQAQLMIILQARAGDDGLILSGPFNLGEPDDFRVPDAGLHSARAEPDPDSVYLSTAVVALEIVSPGDETLDKLPFYAAHGVDEVIVVDPAERRVAVLALTGDHYAPADASSALGISTTELAAGIR
jgi:Uma2 family endonuclease